VDDLNVSDYQRNRKRQNALISYAAPYRLNVVTTDGGLQTGSRYRLEMVHPKTLHMEHLEIARENIDTLQDPERVLRGYIDQMKRKMERKYPLKPDLMDSGIIAQLHEHTKPFNLAIRSSYDLAQAETTVELTVKHDDYGFKPKTLKIGDNNRHLALNTCKMAIDRMRAELGWKKAIDEAGNKVAQPIKPFVLECPEHGGAMSKVVDKLNNDEYYVCLVPGCKKKARQKNRVQSGGFGPLPSQESSTAGALGNDFLSLQFGPTEMDAPPIPPNNYPGKPRYIGDFSEFR